MRIETGNTTAPDGQQRVSLTISDTGTGMSPEVLARAAEPYFTTKADARGSGLGLASVCDFVRRSGGTFQIASQPGHGATLCLSFPPARTAKPSAGSRMVLPRQITGCVLIVEHNVRLRRAMRRQLTMAGCRCLATADAARALQVLAREPAIDLLLTDTALAGAMDGRVLAPLARRRHTSLRIVLTSAERQAGGVAACRCWPSRIAAPNCCAW